jgi:hypothetical protein
MGPEMNEGLFYGLFFTGILLNYVLKLNLERKGSKLERSNLREGLVLGVTAYLFYQASVHPEISGWVRAIDLVLGILSVAAAALFFLKGRLR